jgi:rfaE bifunctional protein kinase chain/domain/rfaE bifunctional protein nucleotidyltransferase chain/domain
MDHIYKKIKTIDELKGIIQDLKKENKKVVHCHGVFDLVHPGHIRHLAAAKKEGDILVVTITADSFVRRGPGRPIFNEDLRAETLAAIGSVDFVSIDHNPTAINTIKAIKPDVYVKGQEYEKKDKDVTGKIYDEEEAIQSVGGRLAFTYDITFSSSKLINEHLDVYPPETRKYLKEMSAKYPIDVISEKIKSTKKLKTLVIGDAIIDQYHYCESMGKSLKEHLVVSKYLAEESFAGGSLAVANHVAGLVGEVELVTVLGKKDPFEEFIKQRMQPNVSTKFFYRGDAPTTIKRRFVNSVLNRKLFEVCYMDDTPVTGELEKEIIDYLNKVIADYDLVIVADFGHGMLNQNLVDIVCSKAKFMALNVQTNSANTGFNLVTKYHHSDYISIDEPEIRLAAHDKHGEMKNIMQDILKQLDCKNLMVTRGHQGSLNYDKIEGFHQTPAFASKVVDRIGAGDALFAFTAPCMAMGFPKDLTSFIGNAVGALAVQIVCNRKPVDVVDLIKYMTRLLK